MDFTIADVAAASERALDATRRRLLQELALSRLLLDLTRRDLALLGAHVCRLSLDARLRDGEHDERDGAAA